MKKLSIFDFNKMKSAGKTLTWVTAYDFPTGYVAEKAGIDMILVGDSGGMVQLGYPSTNPVTMEEMLTMANSVRRATPHTFIIGDMPQGAYEISKEKAVKNGLRFIKEAQCDAIKCEGGIRVADKIKAIVDAGILVAGHLGLTPQSSSSFGGYRVQGKSMESFESTMEDALALQEAGVYCLLLEAMPPEPAGQIAKQLTIPVYGIGAGNQVDGQLLIMHDLLGYYPSFRPKFAKCYIPEVLGEYQAHLKEIDKEEAKKHCKDGLLLMAEMAIKKYVEEVREKKFPDENYMYKITQKDLDEVMLSKYWVE